MKRMLSLVAVLVLVAVAVSAAESSVFLVKFRQPGTEKKIEDFAEFQHLQTLWQLPAVMSFKPNGPHLTEQLLLIKVPESKAAGFQQNGYHRIERLYLTIEVARVGYCFGMPSGTVKKSGTTATSPETALWMLGNLFLNPFQSLQNWEATPGLAGLHETLTRAPRQDNGWQFKINCSVGVKLASFEDGLSAEIARVNGKPDFKVGFKEAGLPLPIFQIGMETAWVENDNQGPATFESPMNLGDMGQKGASVKAGRGRDAWARNFQWVAGAAKPYYGTFNLLRDGKVWRTTSYSRDAFAKLARQNLKLTDRDSQRH